MNKIITQTIVDGYGSGETDFLVRLGQADPQVQLDFKTEIVQPILEGGGRPSQTVEPVGLAPWLRTSVVQ